MKRRETAKTRWLKGVVRYCIGFTSFLILLCYIAAWWGVDTENVLATTRLIFGGELLMTVVIKLVNKDAKELQPDPEKTEDTQKG